MARFSRFVGLFFPNEVPLAGEAYGIHSCPCTHSSQQPLQTA